MGGLTELARGGARLCLEDVGTGPLCVFQHGLGGDRTQAAQNFPQDIGWRRLTLECRAHGASEAGTERPFSLALFAEDVLAACRAAGGERFVAGGVSMGAAIALRLALLRPDAVRALVLVRPAWGWEAAPPNMHPYALAAEAVRNLPQDRDAARARFARTPEARHLAGTAPDNLKSLLGFFDRPDLRTTADLLHQVATDGPGVSQGWLASLALPTLVVGNGEDEVHPLPLAETLADRIPAARLVVVPPKAADAARHQAAVRGAIAQFLSTLPPDTPDEPIR